eukprot:6222421-Prymnesium_polylepis.1
MAEVNRSFPVGSHAVNRSFPQGASMAIRGVLGLKNRTLANQFATAATPRDKDGKDVSAMLEVVAGAARRGDLPQLTELLRQGRQDLVGTVKGSSWQLVLDSALLASILANQRAAATKLIDAGADPCSTDFEGSSFLARAVASADNSDRAQLVELLLLKGAQKTLERADSSGRRVIEIAAERGTLEAFKQLLLFGAEVDERV